MKAVKSLSSVKTASRCFVPVRNRQFNALSNNPIFYSQITYNRIIPDYHLQNPIVNNNGGSEHSNTEVHGEKLYIDNSHLRRKQESSNERFEPVVYSPEEDAHSIGGNIIN